MSNSKPLIALTGFMGSGKTSVAVALARLLGCRSLDLDTFVNQIEERSPGEIIQQDGEDSFRKTETRLLKKALEENGFGVIALGGGTWTIAENRALLAKHECLSVWLDAPFDLCWQRIEASDSARPLATSHETANRRYQERLGLYQLAACRVGISSSETAEEIAAKIAAAVLRKADDPPNYTNEHEKH